MNRIERFGRCHPRKVFPAMSLVLSLIIGVVVLVFAGLAFAPLLLTSTPSNTGKPVLTVIEGGKSGTFEDAA